MAGDRYQDEEFIGWLKVNLSLIFAKEGLEQFSDDEVQTLHDNIKHNIPSSSAPSSSASGLHTCNDKRKLAREWDKRTFSCQADQCDQWLGGIQRFYASAAPVEWANSDLARLSVEPWACAKLYMPHGCASHTQAKDADIAALLTLYLRCSCFFKYFSNVDDCQKVKEIRNRMSHSRDMKADTTTVQADTTVITEFLQKMQSLKPQHQLACQEALQKINELLSGKMELSLNREYELQVLNINLQKLVNEVDALATSVQQLSSMAQDVTSNTEELKTLKIEQQRLNSDLTLVKSQSSICNQFLKDHAITGVSTEMLSEVSDKIARLESQIQTQLTELSGRVEQLEVHYDSMKKKQDELEENQGGVKRAVDEVREEQGGMKRVLDEVCEEQGGMKRVLDEVCEEQTQAKKRAVDDQPVNAKDIQDRLIDLYSQTCQKIPIFPLRPEWRTHVASLFVLPSMRVTDPLGISKHHLMRGTDEGSDIKVTSLQDIFPPAGSSCTDIYIMGDAGTGKSTLCEYLVHLWVSCRTSSNQASEAAENFMENFEFLFFISLREATSCNVEEMIKSQLQLKDVNTSRLLYDHSSLIILDGLDEYSLKQTSRTRFGSENLPSRRYSSKCTVLTTSRPWKLELLTRELEHRIDRQITIVGLDTESQEKLVRKVADLLNSRKRHDKSPADFISEVQAQKLEKIMMTPILLMQMLGLWFSGEPMGGSKCSIYAKLMDKQIQFAEEVRSIPTDPQCHRVAPSMPEVQHNDETMCDLFSTFLKNYTYIMSNKKLLQKVCKFAYCSLSTKDRESSLIFSHEQMELFDMSHEEILLCLHLGLLTQYKVLGEITQRLKWLSFVHKSHQEFFAAIYLSQRNQATELKQLLEKDFTSLSHILEMETVFMFVCGMNPSVARDISSFIMDKTSGDARLEQYRQYCEDWSTTDPNTALVKQLQGLILAGIEEGRHNGHKITGMQLQDLYMNVRNQDCPPARVLACTGSLDLSHVKSLYIQDKGAISIDELQQLLKETKNLKKLVLSDTVVSVDMFQRVVQVQQTGLQTLALMNVSHGNMDISHLNLDELYDILSAPTNSLTLHGVVLTHSQLEFLCQHVSSSSYGEVRLGHLQCTTHGYRGTECKQSLDLSASRNLSRLVLQELPVNEVRFVPENLVRCDIVYLPEPVDTSCISCLQRAEKLEVLRCVGLRGSTVVELSTTMPHLVHLQYIGLYNINLSGQQQVVRAVAQLKKLEYISLYSVTMREEDLRELLAALPSSHRVTVVLGYSSGSFPVTITDYNRHTHLLEHIRHNPHTHVYRDEVEFEGDTCIVKEFWFNTKK